MGTITVTCPECGDSFSVLSKKETDSTISLKCEPCRRGYHNSRPYFTKTMKKALKDLEKYGKFYCPKAGRTVWRLEEPPALKPGEEEPVIQNVTMEALEGKGLVTFQKTNTSYSFKTAELNKERLRDFNL